MEFRKTKKYVYSLVSDDFMASDLVGLRALDLHRLSKCNVDVADGFVISGHAFDEFLLANELVDDVVRLLNKIADSGIAEVENYSLQMRKLILDGAIPKHIVVEIDKAYHALAKHSDASVTVGQSPLVKELDERLFKQDWQATGYQNLQGLQAVLEQVMLVWADLFTTDAIKHRFETDYEGNLSQPVIVQKQLNPEVSGQMFNFELKSGSTNSASVLGYLGLLPFRKQPGQIEFPVDADFYLVDKVRSGVVEKILHEQKFMLVRNKGLDTNDYSKVKISKMWSQRAKLDDQQLVSLNKTLALVETAYLDRFRLTWVYDAGTFLVTDIEVLSDEAVLSELAEYYIKLQSGGGASSSQHSGVSASNSSITVNHSGGKVLAEIASGRAGEVPVGGLEETVGGPAALIALGEMGVTALGETGATGSKDGASLYTGTARTPVKTTPTPTSEKDSMLAGLNKTPEELIMPEQEREAKAGQLKQMLPEIKTASEVWWYPRRPASEVKVFAGNLDGLGVFSLDEIVQLLGTGELRSSQALQKQVCEYLALYLKAIAPAPLLLALSPSQHIDGQIQVLSQLRNLYGHRNFWVCLPPVSSHEKLATFKKDLSAGGFRRTAGFKVYQMISQPIYFSSLGKIFEQGIDGVIIDLDKIVEHLYGSHLNEVVLHIQAEKELILGYLNSQLSGENEFKTKMLIKTESREIFDMVLEPLLEQGINGVVYCWQDVYEFKSNLAAIETDMLTSSLKKIKKKLNKI